MPARGPMVESAGKILEGVFAVKKPPSLSSAQVLRELQHAFANSKIFQPLLEQTKEKEKQNAHRSKRRRIDGDNVFKMGHGGTLDPLATGVLIVGVGRGTKFLQNFLYCTKTYETVVLFGKSTDTYDISGKVVATAATSQITQRLVQEKLAAFRGTIKQVPPIYSALKIDGMKAYDYARTGKELPRELPARDMEVSACELIQWYEPGKHQFRWPAIEASAEEKFVFEKFVNGGNSVGNEPEAKLEPAESSRTEKEGSCVTVPESQEVSEPASEQPHEAGKKPLSLEEKAALHTHEITGLSDKIADAPAARVRLTVSSGFYVRSFAHDLGLACGSYATMAELARTRQADFAISDPAPEGLLPSLDRADIAGGEEVWGPKITLVLNAWLEKNPAPNSSHSRYRIRDSSDDAERGRGRRGQHGRKDNRKRRNSSSPEP